MVKVRLQLVGEGGAKGSTSPIYVFRNVLKNEGALALYKGLDAGIIRQVSVKAFRHEHLQLFTSMSSYVSRGFHVHSTTIF